MDFEELFPDALMQFYTVDSDGTPIRCTCDEAVVALAMLDRVVEKTNISADQSCDGQECEVSTVFFPLDLNMSLQSHEPELWETMIFGQNRKTYQERYTSLKAAKIGHKRAVWIARGGLDQEQANGQAG